MQANGHTSTIVRFPTKRRRRIPNPRIRRADFPPNVQALRPPPEPRRIWVEVDEAAWNLFADAARRLQQVEDA